jgi:hypothetical protein
MSVGGVVYGSTPYVNATIERAFSSHFAWTAGAEIRTGAVTTAQAASATQPKANQVFALGLRYRFVSTGATPYVGLSAGSASHDGTTGSHADVQVGLLVPVTANGGLDLGVRPVVYECAQALRAPWSAGLRWTFGATRSAP